MTRRASDISTASIALAVRERFVLDEMRTAGRFASDSDVIRVALYRFAVHLGLDIDTDVFHVRSGRPSRRVRHQRNTPADVTLVGTLERRHG